MPSKHANPLMAWRPPAELGARIRAAAESRGQTMTEWLNEAATWSLALAGDKLAAEPHAADLPARLPRADCDKCGRSAALRRNGVLREHNDRSGVLCAGSGLFPVG